MTHRGSGHTILIRPTRGGWADAGALIRTERKSRGWSQQKLSDSTVTRLFPRPVSLPSIVKIEAGDYAYSPMAATLIRVLNAIGWDLKGEKR